MLKGQQKLLSIYLAEDEQQDGIPLFEWLVKEAKKNGLAGATIFKGLEGYGAHREIHTSRILRLSEKLPIVIQIIDTQEQIEKFIPVVDSAICEGLVIVQDVDVRIFKIKE